MDVLRGKYRLERMLGQGGMGEVWLATHVRLGQKIAVKRMLAKHAANPQHVARFLREARTAATLTSDHAVRIIDVDEAEDGAPFFVMEYLEGSDLESLLAKEGPIDASRSAKWMIQACEALAQAHARGIVHRDIKPANLFLARRPNGTSVIKILDFGISKMSESEGVQITTTQTVIGSPVYMSPEQIRASRDVDARADIWAIGVVLAQLVTKKLPFTGTAPTAVAAAITADAPDLEGVPDVLRPAIERCLAKRPGDRYPSVVELAADLARVAGNDALAESVRATALAARDAPDPAPAAAEEVRKTESLELVQSTAGASATGRSVRPPAPRKRWRWVFVGITAVILLLPVGIFLRESPPRRPARQPPPPATSTVAAIESMLPIAPAMSSAPVVVVRDAGVRIAPVVTPTKARDPLDVPLK